MILRHSARHALVPIFILLVGTGVIAQERRPPTIDDIIDLVQVSAAQVSPDGQRVLYTRSEVKAWKDNKRISSIWMADTEGHNAYQFLGNDKDRAAQWSPDGTLVAFLSTRDQKETDKDKDADSGAQLWLIRTTGGEAWKLSDHKDAVRTFKWSADGRQIFFVADERKTDEEKAAEKAGDDAIFVDEGPNGQERGRFAALWVITVADKTERRITTDRILIGGLDPAPDGRQVALTYRKDNLRNAQNFSEVAVVDVASGNITGLTKNEAPEGDVKWSPDGALLAFTAPDDRRWELAQEKIWIVPAGGGTPKRISDAYTGDIGNYFWTPDGKSILLGGTRNGRGGVYRLDIDTGDVRPIEAGGSDRIANLDSINRDATRAAGIVSSPLVAGEVHVLDFTRAHMTRVTAVNPQVLDWQLAQFRAITWKSRDGLDVEGLLWLPSGYTQGTRLPLLVSVHGGPAGVWATSFRGINHVYAGLGWAILEPNVRGSTSYGDALLRGNIKDIGGGDYEDLMAGVDTLVAQGLADPDKLAIRGWSYGGILGGWTITQTTRFKAASLGAMVSDWTSEYAMGFNHDIRLWYIGGAPWESPDAYRRQSPATHVAKVATPTLILHGEQDTTDTIGQSMIFYQGLKDRGVPVRFIRFPREPHGFREPHHVRIRDAEEIAWLMKYARGIEWKAPERKDRKDEEDRKKITTAGAILP